MARKLRSRLDARRNVAGSSLADLIKNGEIEDGASTKVVIDSDGNQKIVVVNPVTGLTEEESAQEALLNKTSEQELLNNGLKTRQQSLNVDIPVEGNNPVLEELASKYGVSKQDIENEVASKKLLTERAPAIDPPLDIEKVKQDVTELEEPLSSSNPLLPDGPERKRDFFNEPEGIDPEIQKIVDRVSVDMDIEGDFHKRLKGAIDGGDVELTDALIDQGRKIASLVGSFRKDLSPEAMMVDRLRARTQRRQGLPETNQLTRSGQFEGEKRSAFDLEQESFGRNLRGHRLIGNLADAKKARGIQERALKNNMMVAFGNIENKIQELKLTGAKLQISKDAKSRKALNDHFERTLNEANAMEDAVAAQIQIAVNSDNKELVPALMKKLEELQSKTGKIRKRANKALNDRAVREGRLNLRRRLQERDAK